MVAHTPIFIEGFLNRLFTGNKDWADHVDRNEPTFAMPSIQEDSIGYDDLQRWDRICY
jgi:hypothetical protein